MDLPRRLAPVALAPALLALAACGFTPLYATPGVSSGLSSIQVVAPDGRVGFLLQEDLDDLLAHDKDAKAQWRLDFTVVQKRDPRGLTVSDYAQRYQVGITVAYTLTNLGTGEVIHKNTVISEVAYDAANDPYAGIAAREDTQKRAAADAARKIEVDLLAFMARRAGK